MVLRINKRVALLAATSLVLPLAALSSGPQANAATFGLSNTNLITINDNADASPYPSSITQYGLSTVITDVNVTLNNLSHTYPDDMDVEVVSPQGTAVALMSDACGSTDIVGRTITFDDQAGSFLPDSTTCDASGTFKPTTYPGTGSETWAVAPVTTLAAFNGQNPNSVAGAGWRLYVRDDEGSLVGTINGGWTITITTASTAPIVVPAFGSSGSGVAAPYGAPVAVSGRTGLITDVNVTIPGLSHTWPADLRIVVASPTGKTVALMGGDCGNLDILQQTFTFDDQAAASISAGTCTAGGTFKPRTGAALTSLPSPAPVAPYGTTLSALNGDSPNGTWQFYIDDTVNTDGGFMGTPTLTITTTDVVAPDTQLVGKKPENTTKRKATISFKSTEVGSTFQCKVDSASYQPCSSPLKLKNLALGKHKVFIRATDAAGNTDAKALKLKWKIFPK